jgi:ureidoacrylate peracid hydrolase
MVEQEVAAGRGEPAGPVIPADQCALVVIDVQNDYCHDDGVFGRNGAALGPIQAAVDRIPAVVDVARRVRVPVIWVRTEHGPFTDSPMWLSRRVRSGGAICVAGSWGAEFYRVRPAPDERVVVKHRYSAFVGSALPVVLRSLGRPVLLFAGVTTNVCVESTLRDAFMRDWSVALVEDCAAALTKEEHEAAAHNVRTYFGRVLDSAALEGYWTAPGCR